MKIETKFNYYDKCYTMLDNKVYVFEVEQIDIRISPKLKGDKMSIMEINIIYFDYECKHWFNERNCFASKEELLASL